MLTVTAALSMAMMSANPGIHEDLAQVYAHYIVELTREAHIDPWLVEALIYRESRWRPSAFRWEYNGTCSVGLGQINLVQCGGPRSFSLQVPLENLRATIFHLTQDKALCTKVWSPLRCHSVYGYGWVGLYNPGAPQYAGATYRVMQEHRKYYHALPARPTQARPSHRFLHPSLYLRSMWQGEENR